MRLTFLSVFKHHLLIRKGSSFHKELPRNSICLIHEQLELIPE